MRVSIIVERIIGERKDRVESFIESGELHSKQMRSTSGAKSEYGIIRLGFFLGCWSSDF
jgi:hypothetical protein